MLEIFKPIRAIEFNTPVWRSYGRHKPTCCPGCNQHKTWNHIGFDPNYTKGSQAKTFQCNSCGTRLDCVTPKVSNRRPVLVAAAV